MSSVSNASKEQNFEYWAKYNKTSDSKLLKEWALANKGLVYMAANSFQVKNKLYADLIQEGFCGLMQGTKRYNGRSAYSTYVTYWIKAYMYAFVKSMQGVVAIPSSGKNTKLFWNLAKIANTLTQQGLEATDAEIAKLCGTTEQAVSKMRNQVKPVISLDLPSTLDDGETGENLVLAELSKKMSVSPEERFANAEFKSHLKKFIASLQGRESNVFESRFLLAEPMTLEAIGAKYSITKERTRQIEAGLLSKLRKNLSNLGYQVAKI